MRDKVNRVDQWFSTYGTRTIHGTWPEPNYIKFYGYVSICYYIYDTIHKVVRDHISVADVREKRLRSMDANNEFFKVKKKQTKLTSKKLKQHKLTKISRNGLYLYRKKNCKEIECEIF